MQKITKPTLPDYKNHIISEGIDYQQTGNTSIFGLGDADTISYLSDQNLTGIWLDLGGGDGRYLDSMINTADKVYLGDIDEGAISKVWHNLNLEQRKKLIPAVFDITKRFPFNDAEFDGIFCTGFLHLFPGEVIVEMIKEVTRTLKPGGRFIFDFATDIKREQPDGTLVSHEGAPEYTDAQGMDLMLGQLEDNFKIKHMFKSNVNDDLTKDTLGYNFSCNYFLMDAYKNN